MHAPHVGAHAGLVLGPPGAVGADDRRLLAALEPQMRREVPVPPVDLTAAVAGVVPGHGVGAALVYDAQHRLLGHVSAHQTHSVVA